VRQETKRRKDKIIKLNHPVSHSCWQCRNCEVIIF